MLKDVPSVCTYEWIVRALQAVKQAFTSFPIEIVIEHHSTCRQTISLSC